MNEFNEKCGIDLTFTGGEGNVSLIELRKDKRALRIEIDFDNELCCLITRDNKNRKQVSLEKIPELFEQAR